MSIKLDIFLLDNSNNIIEETSLKKPKTYQELVQSIKKQLKNLPNYFNIFYQSPNNNEIIIYNNEEYNLSIDVLFIREKEQNELKKSIYTNNYESLSESKQNLLDEYYNCYICSEIIKYENPYFCYSCQKIFHNKCLKNWDDKRRALNENLNCPNCRKELPLEQWKKKLNYEENRIKDIEILNKLNQYELNSENKEINKNEIIEEYTKYKEKTSNLFKSILTQMNEINLLIKQGNIYQKINTLIKEISIDSINLSINNISNIICDELEILKKYIFKNKDVNIYKTELYESGDKYIGEFTNGLKNGKGTYYWNDGDKYVGEYKNGKKDGKGIFYFKNGDRYEGEYKNDKRDGECIYYFIKGNKYIGGFKNGLFEGKGTMIYYDGDRYEGEYKNDKKNGKGIYYYNDGERYEGDFKNGKKEGKCIYYYKNGARYEGEFKDGKKEGKGIYYYKNGDREIGDYLNGKEVGKHVTLHANGEISSKIY